MPVVLNMYDIKVKIRTKIQGNYSLNTERDQQGSATDVFNVLIMRSENTDYSKDWLLSDMATLVD